MSESREQRVAAARVRMAELAAKFVARTRGELTSMRDALTRLSAGDAAALAEIRHFAHRVSGTGATLGFEQLSECGARIEKLADTQPAGRVPGDFALAQLTGAVDALDHELTRAATQR